MELYWLLRLPHLHEIFFNCSGIFGIILFLMTIFYPLVMELLDDMDDNLKLIYHKCFVYFPIFIFISIILSALLPTKTDLALMMGWDAMKSDSVAEIIEILKDKIK